jgi:hypothetical protein
MANGYNKWTSRRFWFAVSTWTITTLLIWWYIDTTSHLLGKNLLTDDIWESVTTGILSLYFMFTGAVLGIYKVSDFASKNLKWKSNNGG